MSPAPHVWLEQLSGARVLSTQAILPEAHALRASDLSKVHQVSNLGLVVGVANSAPDLIALAQQLTDKLCCNEPCSVAPNMFVGALT